MIGVSGTDDKLPPPLAFRRLVGRPSGGGEDEDPAAPQDSAERAEVWRQARAMRNKFVHLGHSPRATSTKQTLQQYFEKTPIFKFVGKAGEAHRVFLFSAELWAEATDSPWSVHADPAASQGDAVLDWVVSQTGPADVLLLADGRSRIWRRKLEAKLETARNQHETWIVYRPGKRVGRKVAYGSEHKEVLLVSMPLNRTVMAARPRVHFAHAGEKSTHETSYTGVEPAQLASLPLVPATDKAKLLGLSGGAAPTPKKKWFDTSIGVPLFWQERKTIACWTAILADVQCKAIFDCTPGTGAAARCAMEQGYAYAALTRTQEHCAWLQQFLDRQALRYIATPGSQMHCKDLQPTIASQFSQLITQLETQDEAEDDNLDDESPDDA